jgi:SAM-dependent methyltransferase
VSSGSCCGGDEVAPKGVAAAVAGYDRAELSELPADAVENSFGCGTPVAFAGLVEGDTVLDLGSGAGIDLLLAAQRVGSSGHVIGVDMTDEMIRRARANIGEAGATNVEVRQGIIEELPVDDGSPEWVRDSKELYDSCVSGAIGESEYLAGLRAAGLVDVEVTGRLRYGASQIEAFVDSEVDGCCGKGEASNIADAVQGKVWSVRVIARKP